MPGVCFPADTEGVRSTSAFGKEVFSAVAAALGDEPLAQAIVSEKDWRHTYNAHMLKVFEAQLRADPAVALASLKKGLEKATAMDFEPKDGTPAVPLAVAGSIDVKPFGTWAIHGTGNALKTISVPYNGSVLSGASLSFQLDKWARRGTMEADCAEAIKEGVRLDTFKGRTFILIGAGSELGPLRPLLLAGATVAAVATRKPQRWAELIEFAQTTAGTLLLPVPSGVASDCPDVAAVAAVAGADILAETPALAAWVAGVVRSSAGPVTLGTYLYADGEANVRITAAADVLTQAAMRAAAASRRELSLAYLPSQTVAHVIPAAAAEAQRANAAKAPWWQSMLRYRLAIRPPLSGAAGSAAAEPTYVHDAYSMTQGPNYALAQHMRQWRAMLAYTEGHAVSAPMAPAARTASMLHVHTVATALDGFGYFRPLEAFEPDCLRACLADSTSGRSCARTSSRSQMPAATIGGATRRGALDADAGAALALPPLHSPWLPRRLLAFPVLLRQHRLFGLRPRHGAPLAEGGMSWAGREQGCACNQLAHHGPVGILASSVIVWANPKWHAMPIRLFCALTCGAP